VFTNLSKGAQVYIDLKRFEEAIEDCDKAIAVNKDWLKAYVRKAIAHREQFTDPKAIIKSIEVFKQCMEVANN